MQQCICTPAAAPNGEVDDRIIQFIKDAVAEKIARKTPPATPALDGMGLSVNGSFPDQIVVSRDTDDYPSDFTFNGTLDVLRVTGVDPTRVINDDLIYEDKEFVAIYKLVGLKQVTVETVTTVKEAQ